MFAQVHVKAVATQGVSTANFHVRCNFPFQIQYSKMKWSKMKQSLYTSWASIP